MLEVWLTGGPRPIDTRPSRRSRAAAGHRHWLFVGSDPAMPTGSSVGSYKKDRLPIGRHGLTLNSSEQE